MTTIQLKIKKIIISTITILLPLFVFSQSYIIEYEEKANIENQLKNITDEATKARIKAYLSKPVIYNLYVEKNESFFSKKTMNSQDKESTKIIEVTKNNSGTYKNIETNQYRKETEILGTSYLIDDRLEKIDWKIVNEEKIIGDYKCKRALTKINDEEIEAWYNEDYKIANGPSDFHGLPGLIIELITSKKTYKVLKIHSSKTKLTIPFPFIGKTISKKEYEKLLKEKLSNFSKTN